MSWPDGLDELFVEFASTLRSNGLPIGADDTLTFCAGLSELDATDIMNVYWTGRTTLVRRREHIATYNAVFRLFFLDEALPKDGPAKRMLKASATAGATLEIPNTEQGLPGEISPDEIKLGYVASTSEIYRSKAFADCTDDEMRALRRMMSRLKISPPRRRTFRMTRAKRSNKLDMRRMARDTMRAMGEPRDLAYSKRKEKLRPLVFILDVSGSMADYSRNLLQFAYSARRSNAKVEVYCFGTRLTRITKSLDRRNPDEAMRRAGESVLDWDGGTRIGDSVATFVREARRSRLGRGAIVVICSDGLDRGEPQALATAMESLSRLAHRVIWVNPHKGDVVDYVPATLGMIVANPFIDEMHSGHNLASLEKFAERLSKVG
jgi:uncharacterized protein with von Willebrand factor type A (vWA) domain